MRPTGLTRREFVHGTALAAAGVAAGLGAPALPAAAAAPEPPPDTSKILNYNPNMEYRRLGKTGLMVSAACLGGHSRNNVEQRTEVVTRCIEAGINYIDACWDNEVKRDALALKGRRDRMYLALSHGAKEVRNEEYRTAKKLVESLDALLLDSEQDYTDLWRITCLEPGGRHTFDTACEIVEALTQAKQQGKARHLGFSSHDRRWIKFMIEYFPQIEVVCPPFTTLSKAAPKDSLFDALKSCDVGAFGIKPFAAGSLFTGQPAEDLKRARLAIRYILHSQTVVPIPGLQTVAEVDNAVKAISERRQLDLQERAQLDCANDGLYARLPAQYEWLKNWEYV